MQNPVVPSRSRLFRLALAGLILPFAASAALAITSSQQQALKSSCQSDFRAHCASVSPGGSEALQCLEQNLPSLSAGCQQAVTAATGKPAAAPAATPAPAGNAATTAAPATGAAPSTPAQPTQKTKPATAKAATPPPLTPRQEAMIVRQSCAADFRRYCGTVPMGGGNGIACLRANATRLSSGCKQALAAARR